MAYTPLICCKKMVGKLPFFTQQAALAYGADCVSNFSLLHRAM